MSREFLPLDTAEAQDAVNAALASPIKTDRRLEVRGCATLTLDAEIADWAQQQERVERDLHSKEQQETARLAALRERLAEDDLGLTWWVDRYADLQFATGDPETKARAVVKAFAVVRAALRRQRFELLPNQRDAALARADELLTALETPDTGARAAGLLEQLVHILHSDSNRQERRK